MPEPTQDQMSVASATAPGVDPIAAVVPNHIATQIEQDLQLAKQAIVLANGGHTLELLRLALQNKGLIEKQVEEVKEVIPLIKAGYKTTEFWVQAFYLVLNTACIATKTPIPPGADAVMGGVVAVYTVIRHLQKKQ